MKPYYSIFFTAVLTLLTNSFCMDSPLDDESTCSPFLPIHENEQKITTYTKKSYPNSFLYNAYVNNKKAGFIDTINPSATNSYGKILYLDVTERYQKKGIGSQLLQYAINDLKKLGAVGVVLESVPGGVAFYKKFGFTATKKIPQKRAWLIPMKLDFLHYETIPTQHVNLISCAAYLGTMKIGTIQWYRNDENNDQNGIIHFLEVDKKYRKKGIGKTLIDYAIEDLYSKRIMILSVNSSQSTQKFYEKIGFIVTSHKKSLFIPMKLHITKE